MEQLDLPFGDEPFEAAAAALWTPRDIWVRLDQRVIEYLGEDRRFERKGNRKSISTIWLLTTAHFRIRLMVALSYLESKTKEIFLVVPV